jgi:protein SCO1/2
MNAQRLILIFAALAVVALGGAIAWRLAAPQPEPPAAVGGPFKLVDQNGRAVDEEVLKGRWSAVFFGFTYCPDVCPTTLAAIGRVLDLLGDSADQVAPLFVTVDPERDTPAVLSDYVAAFHPRIVGLTGTPEQVAHAARSFRIFYGKEAVEGAPDGHLMSHSGYIYLMNPSGGYEAVFTENRNTPEDIAAEIRRRLGTS